VSIWILKQIWKILTISAFLSNLVRETCFVMSLSDTHCKKADLAHTIYTLRWVFFAILSSSIFLYIQLYSVLHIHCQPFLSILLRKTHYKVNVFPLTRRSNAGDLILQNASEITASRIFLKQQHFASNYCMFHQILLLAPTPRKRRFNACMTLPNSAKRQNEILYFKDFLRFLYTDDFTIICV
jgi:hypothetical protein